MSTFFYYNLLIMLLDKVLNYHIKQKKIKMCGPQRENEFGQAVIAMRGPHRENGFGKVVIDNVYTLPRFARTSERQWLTPQT